MLEIRLLGQFDMRFGGKPIEVHSRPAQSLLAYLVLNAGVSQRREKLAGMLWPDSTEAKSRSYLRQALWRIRKALTAYPLSWRDYMRTDDISVEFGGTSDCWLDVDVVLERVDAQICSVEELIQIASVYRGELLPGFYDEWVYLERERLRAAYEHKMKLLLDRLLRDQCWEDVLHWGEQWISLGYASETAYRELMIAHACMGNTSSAIATFNRCVENLERELGVEPSHRTQEIHEQLVNGEIPEVVLIPPIVPERDLTDEPPAPGEPPFKGMQFFDESDADIFFGREVLTASLVNLLREGQSLLVVVGASGSGKSSIVRAGLVPALRCGEPLVDGKRPPKGSQDWLIRVITPTPHPLMALATSLTRDHETSTDTTTLRDDLSRDPRSLHLAAKRITEEVGAPKLMLVIDQFEELFTLCREEVERKAFINNLLAAVEEEGDGPITVVITLRADFYAHCSAYSHLRKAIAKHQDYIGPMSAREMRLAIEEPARRGEWEFQPGMVDLFLRDVKGEPGALPLLSHALLETWRRRSGRTMTLKGYAAAGGVPGAIAKTAETVFNHYLTLEQQVIARNIFLRLTELGEGTQDTRRRVTLSELIPGPAEAPVVEEVIKKLADARLITTYEATAEVAHEALIREWPTLREWLEEDREGLKLHRHLTESAQEWEGLNRDPGELYRGARLAQVVEFASSNDGDLNELEREFLNASEDLAVQKEAEREAQRLRELEAAQKLAETESKRAAEKIKSVRRLRWFALGLTALLLIVAAIGIYAVIKRDQLENEARLRTARDLAAAAMEHMVSPPELGLLLAIEALNEAEASGLPVPPDVIRSLYENIRQNPRPTILQGHTRQITSIVYHPDGTSLASASQDGTARVWDSIAGDELLLFSGHRDEVSGIDFHPSGERIATSSHDGTVKVWDRVTGEVYLTLSNHNDAVEDVTFSPDGSRLATASQDKSTRIWDAISGEELLTLTGYSSEVTDVAFSPDGSRLAGACKDGVIIIWDAYTADELLRIDGFAGESPFVEFNPSGLHLASMGYDGNAIIWNAVTGDQLFTSTSIGIVGAISDIAFNNEGTSGITVNTIGEANIWNTDDGGEFFLLPNHKSPIYAAAFSPDGTHVVTGDSAGKIRVWDVSPCLSVLTIKTPDNARNVAYNPDGSLIAAGVGNDGVVKIWDSRTGEEIHSLSEEGHTNMVESVEFSPDGSLLATASIDRTVKIWDVASGQCINTFDGEFSLNDVAFSPDGTRIAAANIHGVVRIWDLISTEMLLSFETSMPTIQAIAFNPDGTQLALVSYRGGELWDATSGDLLLPLGGDVAGLRDVEFSPDGTRLAAASSSAFSAYVWDTSTGQQLLTLHDPLGPVKSIAYDVEGDRLTTVNEPGHVRVWDTESGHELMDLYTCQELMSSIDFHPNGNHVAVSGEEAIQVFIVDIDDLVAEAESHLTRGFTNEECWRFLRPERCEPPMDTPTTPYAFAFNEGVPVVFELQDPAYLGKIEGRGAVILKGFLQGAAQGFYASASWVDINLSSYRLDFDLYLSQEPNEETAFAVNLMMPDDALRYKFFFKDSLDVQHWVNSQQMDDLFTQVPHTLKAGWNNVSLMIDMDAQSFDVSTNGDLIIEFSNKVLNTTELLFETHSLEVYGIDNLIISPQD